MDTEPEMVRDTQLVPTQPDPPAIPPLDATKETIAVTGGVAGHVAMTEDLRVAVLALDEAAGLVAEATNRAVVTENEMGYLSLALLPDEQWQLTRAQWAVARIMAGPTGTHRAEMALTDLRDRLRITVDAMEHAENASSRTISWVTRAKEALLDHAEMTTYVPRAILAGAWFITPAGFLSRAVGNDPVGSALAPDLPGTTGVINRDVLDSMGRNIPDGVLQAASMLLAARLALEELRWTEPHYMTMSRQNGLYDDREAPESLADLVRTVHDIEERGDGSVAIQRVPGEAGDKFIVSIPGTQDWWFQDGNVNDAQADTAAMAGYFTTAMQAVMDAMTLAGIPADADVMLVGHSQGGIGAMALASTPWFLDRFNVTHVVTTGACVARFDTPAHVQSLHFEHPEDIVPGLDFQANPDRPNQTTVTHAISQSPNQRLADMAQSVGGAHHLDGYIASAEVAESGISTSVDLFKASASDFLTGGPGVTTTVYTQVTMPAHHAVYLATH